MTVIRKIYLGTWFVFFLLFAFGPLARLQAQGIQNHQGGNSALQENVILPDSILSHRTIPILARNTAEKASFSVKIKDLVSPYHTLGVFVLPGEKVDIETIYTRPGQSYTLSTQHGEVVEAHTGEWSWVAPQEAGAYTLLVEGPFETMRLNVFVKTVFDNETRVLGGYKIGAYEDKPLRQNPLFNPPAGLIEVNERTATWKVSPHFTLGSFASHQPGAPKFVMLDERLVIKLEMLLAEAKQQGIDVTTFTIMSGYRTPWYNKQIGNKTRYSLHLYGRATDIYIDEDKDGRMDDLNKDGRIDVEDAKVLYDIAEQMDQIPWYQPFVGGLGLYGSKPHRGPFVHVDVRGYKARW